MIGKDSVKQRANLIEAYNRKFLLDEQTIYYYVQKDFAFCWTVGVTALVNKWEKHGITAKAHWPEPLLCFIIHIMTE